MDPAMPPQLSVYIPTPVTSTIPRVPVVRKAVPSRKPVGQSSISTPKSAQPIPTEARKSVSSTLNSSPTFSESTTNPSSISSFSAYSLVQPQSRVKDELPEGWTSALDLYGRTYYMNHSTKATSWNKPELNPSLLPPEWEERMTTDGKVYYGNAQTQVTTWERPSAVLTENANPSIRQELPLSPLPLWWEERTTSDGKVYFCNTQTHVTTWECPSAVQQSANPDTMRSMQQEQLLSPLSSVWEERTVSDGRTYFYNTQTQVTTWERPSMIHEHQPASPPVSPGLTRSIGQEQALSPLTSEWEERTTSDGRIYFCNILTHVTTWERPFVTSGQQQTPPISGPETSRSFQPDQPPTPLSPGIDWECPQWQPKSSRRRSHFSLSSISSASSNAMSKLKLPSSTSSSAVMKGTKNAAELSLKGMKSAGKAMKNNKGVILVSLKVVNGILKETTGISLGGLEGLLDGDLEFGCGEEGEDGEGTDEEEEETECEDLGADEVEEEEVLEQPSQQEPIPRAVPVSMPRKQKKKSKPKGVNSKEKVPKKTADVLVREIIPTEKKSKSKANQSALAGSLAGVAKNELKKGLKGMLLGDYSDDSSGGEEQSDEQNDEGDSEIDDVDDGEEDCEDEECEEGENVATAEVIMQDQVENHDDVVVEEQAQEEPYVVDDQQTTPYTQDVYPEQEDACVENIDVVCTDEDVIAQEEQAVQDNAVQEELTIEQQAAFCGGFPDEGFWAEESNAWATEDVTTGEEIGGQDEIVVESGFQETAFEQTTVEEVTVQESTLQETTFEQTTVVQETTVIDEAIIVDNSATCLETQQVSVEETTIVTTEVQSVETLTNPPDGSSDPELIQEFLVEPPPCVEVPPTDPITSFEQPLVPQEYTPSNAPLEPFVFEPTLAAPMMVEPPAQANGVVFVPTYV